MTDMQYYTDIQSYQGTGRTVVTLGKFDSLHRGHQKLIDCVQKYASSKGDYSIVFAFDMQRDTLLTNEERRERLKGKVDCLIQCPFTEEIREMQAEAFIEDILLRKFHASCIVVGSDFRFGYQRRGNAAMLAQFADRYGYHLEIVDKAVYSGREISSTYIREALAAGDVELAGELLGYPYYMSGKVEYGRQLGRKLGFPTMNVAPENRKIVPKYGVYICRIRVDGVPFEGIGNVGTKPTVTDDLRVLNEVHAFDFHGDAYGKKVIVEFCKFARPERKFASISQLKEQVEWDIECAKQYFNRDSLVSAAECRP